MAYKVAMVSLGCPKNQVDAEMMLHLLADDGFEICGEESGADIIIINTCSFIETAKAEAIENILEAAQYKKNGCCKALIVTGCLAERYKDDVTAEIPEVDLVVGIGSNKNIARLCRDAVRGKAKNSYGDKTELDLNTPRILGGYPFSAYIKIADGCDNCCTYCAIPEIRGRMRSRRIEDVVCEAKRLADGGVKELIVVAQDTTAYGIDIYSEPMLPELLNQLCLIDGLVWIRTLYTYPEKITDKLLDVIARQEKLVKYLDIPLQHIDGELLRRMNRRGNEQTIRALINKIREKIPDITLRTTFITGFPGESEEQFAALHAFVKEMRFDRLGCFAYSAEEGTPAAQFPGQLDEQTKQDRLEHIMEEQLTVTQEKNAARIGSVTRVLIEGYDSYIRCYFGRTPADAPEIDTKLFFISDKPQKIGDFVTVKITECMDYDMLGEIVYEFTE